MSASTYKVSFATVRRVTGTISRDTGIATRLLLALEKQVRAEGFSHAEMEFHARSASAIAFFKENGYRMVSKAMKYSATLLDSTEKLTMRKDFAEFEEAEVTVAAPEAD